MLVVALVPLGLLVVATQLQPNPAGLGTHQQLGLPPCSFRVLLGIRCPGCGMTTSWAYFVRGQWGASMSVNAGGFLLAAAGLATSLIFTRSACSGRLPGVNTQKGMTLVLLGIAIVTLIDWASRLTNVI